MLGMYDSSHLVLIHREHDRRDYWLLERLELLLFSDLYDHFETKMENLKVKTKKSKLIQVNC